MHVVVLTDAMSVLKAMYDRKL